MIPSKSLRKIISKRRKIKLERYAWSKEFEKKIFDIVFLDGSKKTTLKEIFKNGYNIGNCLLTAHYVATILQDSSICTGKVEILKGTKNSEHGDHVWIETEDYIIDTTLMITINKSDVYAKFYKKDYTIVPNFSPADLNYECESYSKKNYPEEYFYSLYKVEYGE
ncbi:MAG: hypothetical protein J6A15_06630 [Clostridia bacterium]|nr:hypothetical protein [Clostridia bacterium]